MGAGAAGLTTAWFLRKQGYIHVTVLEKSDRVGGKCETIEVEHHAIDLAAHGMLAGYTDVMRIASVSARRRTAGKMWLSRTESNANI